MNENQILRFDTLRHTVTFNHQTLTLNPLSFRLLYTLAETPEKTLSVKELIANVWPKVAVGPETLKQRVFVLRQSIKEANITGLSIQAIRGEGYRLIIETSADQVASSETGTELGGAYKARLWHKYRGLTFLLAMMIFVILAYWFMPTQKLWSTNNRVILLTNVPIKDMPIEVVSVYQLWSERLSKENTKGSLQLVLTERIKELPFPIQGRQNRAAIMSYFEVIESPTKTSITLRIVESSTAAILRTDRIVLASDADLDSIMHSQIKGILALIASGNLYLNKRQREDSNHPIWTQLKTLANPP